MSNGQEAEKLECQVGIDMVHKPAVRHDFKKDRLCLIPVVLKLRNFDKNQALTVHVRTVDNL